MPVKTLHITNAWHPTSGGIRTFYRALLEAAERHGRHVRVVVPGEWDAVEDVSAFARVYFVRAVASPLVDRRYRLILPHQFLVPSAGRLWHILDTEQPDLVEICDKYSLCHFAGVLRKVRSSRPALVGLTCERMDDNVQAFVGSSPWLRRFSEWYLRNVYVPQFDAHIANSEYTASELPYNPAHPRPRYVLPMGVDGITFTPARRHALRREQQRRTLGLGREDAFLLYAGRLSAEKHVDLLVDVMRELRLVRAHMIIAGDGPLRPVLEARAAVACPGRMHFIGTVRDRAALADLMTDADLFVHPNPREPFGIAPLEAMAAGLPVVLPDQGGVTSYGNHGNAWLAGSTAADFAAAVMRALADREERERRRTQAFATAAAHRWPVVTAAFFDRYDQIAASHQLRSSRLFPSRDPSAAIIPTPVSPRRSRETDHCVSARCHRDGLGGAL